MTDWLPPLRLLSGKEWEDYLEELYAVFTADFIESKPTFPERRVGLKRYPMAQGKEATFWHFIQEGSIEEERTPDLRRCERIGWPRPVIEAVQSSRVLCWWNTRQTKRGPAERITLALPDFSYVVILDDHGEYVLPWTAFCVEHASRRAKLAAEYRRAGKRLGPPPASGDGPVTPSAHGR